jgi:hypothetical protein
MKIKACGLQLRGEADVFIIYVKFCFDALVEEVVFEEEF